MGPSMSVAEFLRSREDHTAARPNAQAKHAAAVAGRQLFDREQQDRAIDALRSTVAVMGAATFKIKVLPKRMAKKGEASHAHD